MLNNVGWAMAVEKLLGIDRADPRARAVHPRDRRRDVAHHRPPDLPRRRRDGARRVHRVPLLAEGARVALRAARGGLGRAADAQLRAHRRRLRRTCPRTSMPRADAHPRARSQRDASRTSSTLLDRQQDLPRPHGRHRRSSARRTRSPPAGPARSRRSAGVDYDVRKDHPYSVYDRFEFDVPLGTTGDNYDRYLVPRRGDQAVDAHPRQASRRCPAARSIVDDPRVALPPKSETYNTIESMIRHFKHHHGRHPRAARRDLLVRRGRQRRARLLHRRPTAPAAPTSAACGRPVCPAVQIIDAASCHGHLIADIVPTFGMIEHDRRGVRQVTTRNHGPRYRRRWPPARSDVSLADAA